MSDTYDEIKQHFTKIDEVTVNSGKGSQGIKYGKKMFAMFNKGDLLIQLSPARVTELVQSGEAEAYDPGNGKFMKDRVLIPVSKRETWISLCEESMRYAMGK